MGMQGRQALDWGSVRGCAPIFLPPPKAAMSQRELDRAMSSLERFVNGIKECLRNRPEWWEKARNSSELRLVGVHFL